MMKGRHTFSELIWLLQAECYLWSDEISLTLPSKYQPPAYPSPSWPARRPRPLNNHALVKHMRVRQGFLTLDEQGPIGHLGQRSAYLAKTVS